MSVGVPVAKFDLDVQTEDDSNCAGEPAGSIPPCSPRADLFIAETTELLVSLLGAVLTGIAADPASRWLSFRCCRRRTGQLLQAWNDTAWFWGAGGAGSGVDCWAGRGGVRGRWRWCVGMSSCPMGSCRPGRRR